MDMFGLFTLSETLRAIGALEAAGWILPADPQIPFILRPGLAAFQEAFGKYDLVEKAAIR